MRKTGTVFKIALIVALIVIMVAPVMAQVRPAAATATTVIGAIETEAAPVDLIVGRSAVIRTDRPIKRVSLPTPDIADAMVTSPNEVLVHGKQPGTISLLVWGDTGKINSYDIIVRRDLTALEDRVRQLFPGEPIVVTSNGADVVLSGVVSSSYVVDKATSLAAGYVAKKENVVNLLRQDQGLESNQVLLRVRFAEVSRTAVQELGASFFTGANGYKDWIARATTQQFPAPIFDDEKGLVFSDFLNILAFNTQEQLGGVIRALQTKGLFQSLAEPNLVTQNGKEASFLAGGEFPFPVVQGGGVSQAVTIMFKEFGVRLKFTPTITGDDTIHLKVAPEVSALDFANSVTMNGFRVPAISTRRTETEVELRDGQTFAISGLIDNTVTQTMSKIPGLGDIPVLGLLFKSRAYQKNATELVVMITPQIMRRDSVGVTDHLPRLVQPFIPHEQKTLPPPAPAFSTPEARSVAPVGGTQNDQADADAAGAPNQVMPAAGTATKEARAAARSKADDEKRARESEREEAERLEREQRDAAKAAKLAEEMAARQAEAERKAAEKQAAIEREEAKKAEKIALEEAKRQAELDRAAARAERERAEQEAKEAERKQKEQERLDREREKLEREHAKRAAEEQEVAEKLEKMKAEAERKKEDEQRREKEKAQRERAKGGPWPRLRSRI